MISYVQANSSLSSFSPGDPERALLEAAALELAAISLDVNAGLKAAALQGAFSAFSFPPLPAQYASGTVTFTGAGGTSVPAGTQVSTVPSPTTPTITYQTTAAVTLPNGSGNQTSNASVTALSPGAAYNTGASTLTNLVSTVPGISSVTNSAAITNGQDAQTTAQQSQAFGQYVGSLMQGSAASLIQAAKSVSGISQAVVAENPSVVSLTVASGGAVTDNTTEANLPWGAPYQAFASSPAVGDSFVIGGGSVQFSKAYVNLATNGAGLTGSWQYYNGSWASLTLTDGTSSLSASGTVVFTPPSDWKQTTLGSYTGYFIRFTLSSATFTTMAKVNHIFLLNPPPGIVDVVIANGANTITSTVQDQVLTAVQNVRYSGITVNVITATLLSQNVTANVVVAPGYAQSTVSSNVVSAITQYIQGLNIGQSMPLSALTATVFSVPGVQNVTFSPPSSDVNVPNTTLIVAGTIQCSTTLGA